jgi:hypothetical protein
MTLANDVDANDMSTDAYRLYCDITQARVDGDDDAFAQAIAAARDFANKESESDGTRTTFHGDLKERILQDCCHLDYDGIANLSHITRQMNCHLL